MDLMNSPSGHSSTPFLRMLAYPTRRANQSQLRLPNCSTPIGTPQRSILNSTTLQSWANSNSLAQTTRPDIMYAVHQIAKFSADSREPHGKAILYLVRYLKKCHDLGICFEPKPEKGFECYCDADFSGNWTATIVDVDPSTSKSRSGWVVFYA